MIDAARLEDVRQRRRAANEAFYEKEARKEAWAKKHNLRECGGDIRPERLWGKRPWYTRLVLPESDHCNLWRSADGSGHARPLYWTSQPYGINEDEMDAAARENGIAYDVSDDSWHCPGGTKMVVWRLPETPKLEG